MEDARRIPVAQRSPAGGWTDALRRRRLLQGALALPIGGHLAAGLAVAGMPRVLLATTPSCGAGSKITPRQTEGPYFTPDSPRRQVLMEPAMDGARLVLVGQVLAPDCRPQPGALVDFWQADADGAYDNRGHRLRGHQFTDEEGRYRLETVVPGIYPGRTRHIHVKVQARGGPLLTTQLYFPDVPQNLRDGLFSPALLVSLAEATGAPDAAGSVAAPAATGVPARQSGSAVQAGFDFVVRTA